MASRPTTRRIAPENAIIGANFCELRREAHYSQKEVAKLLGVTPAAINQYERGTLNVPLHTARKMALTFGCKIEDFTKGLDEFDKA